MEKIKTWLIPLLKENGCELYDLEWDTSMKPAVLRVMIDKMNGPTDLDTCAAISDVVSEELDKRDEIESEYMLEVCSPGAERELRNDEEIAANVGKYVWAKLKQAQDGLQEVTGTLSDFKDGRLTISYFIKGRPKKAVIEKDNLAKITSAVKL